MITHLKLHTCNTYTLAIMMHLENIYTCNNYTHVMTTHLPATTTHIWWLHTCNNYTHVVTTHLQQLHTCDDKTPATTTHMWWLHTCNNYTRVMTTHLQQLHTCNIYTIWKTHISSPTTPSCNIYIYATTTHLHQLHTCNKYTPVVLSYHLTASSLVPSSSHSLSIMSAVLTETIGIHTGAGLLPSRAMCVGVSEGAGVRVRVGMGWRVGVGVGVCPRCGFVQWKVWYFFHLPEVAPLWGWLTRNAGEDSAFWEWRRRWAGDVWCDTTTGEVARPSETVDTTVWWDGVEKVRRR